MSHLPTGSGVRTGGARGGGMEPEERREWHDPVGKPAECEHLQSPGGSQMSFSECPKSFII